MFAGYVLIRPEVGALARRATLGARALFVRQGLIYGSNIATGIILARLLAPVEFGFYGVVLFFSAFLNVFGGTGFAANLIRTEEHPSLSDLRAVFTAQQIMVAVVLAGILLAAPWLGTQYHLQLHGQAFFSLVGVALALTSLMVVSQVLMERELAFAKLAAVEVTQALAFNVVALILVWRGVGVLSFAIALAVRAGCGALLSNLVEPWSVGWLWDVSIVKRHLRFGMALQGAQFICLAKDSITPLFIGLYLGAAKMGYVTWACTLAGYPTMLLTPLQRLYLPFFARLQSDRIGLRLYTGHAMWIANAAAAPLVILTIVLAHPITIVIFGGKWLPALPLFYFLGAANVVASGSAPMLGLMNALGKSHFTLALSAAWMLTTWAVGVPLMMHYGVIGFGIAALAAQVVNIALYRAVSREVSLSALAACWPSWPIAMLIGGVLLLMQRLSPIHGLVPLIVYGSSGMFLYALVLWFGFPAHSRILRRPSSLPVEVPIPC